jgi:uncharacterized repeat protein (TIGR04076 family)
MKRRQFLCESGGAIAGIAAAPSFMGNMASAQSPRQRRYKIEIDIFEARKDTWCHKKGDKFKYPEDIGKICPWLMSSMHDFIILLNRGVTLSWKYSNTPYEKVIDPDGITTEFVRCPDPTANLVARITRTLVS